MGCKIQLRVGQEGSRNPTGKHPSKTLSVPVIASEIGTPQKSLS